MLMIDMIESDHFYHGTHINHKNLPVRQAGHGSDLPSTHRRNKRNLITFF